MRRPALAGSLVFALLLPSGASPQQANSYRLSLGDAARLAADRSTPVLEARARTEGAQARVRGSLADLLPSLDVDIARSARTLNTASFGLDFPITPGQAPFFDPDGEVVGPIHAADLRARAVVPLLDFGALRRRRSAIAGVVAAREEEGAVSDAAAAAAAQAYLSVLRARAEVTAREEDLALAEDLLAVAEGQLEAGVGVAIDVTRAQSQAATIRAQLLASRHHAETSELTMRRTLRLPASVALELADDLDEMRVDPPPPEQEAIAQALQARSDLSAIEAYRVAAVATVHATRAGRLPKLTAYVDDGFYGEGYGSLLNTYSWTFRLTLPLFDGLDRSSRLIQEEARVREIGYRVEDLQEEVVFQVRQSLLALASAQEQATAAAERLRFAELEVSQEEERLRAGVVGTADVVRAAMSLNAARTANLDALAAVQRSRVALAAAMGTVSLLP